MDIFGTKRIAKLSGEIVRLRSIGEIPSTIPNSEKWLQVDQKTVDMFLKSQTGRKLVEHCRHKLFSDHINASVNDEDAIKHNASIKGANNLLSFILTLGHEDSISGAHPDKVQNTEPDQTQSATESSQRY